MALSWQLLFATNRQQPFTMVIIGEVIVNVTNWLTMIRSTAIFGLLAAALALSFVIRPEDRTRVIEMCFRRNQAIAVEKAPQ
jgi:hypothetical protein